MANWAMTDYVIEGPHETLQKIYDAFLHHDVAEESSDDWEGNILKALGIEWEKFSVEQEGNIIKPSGYYMRGFIEDTPSLGENTLEFYAQEAWGVTDFYKALEGAFPDIKVYYKVEEEGCEVFATNDSTGKYFPDRWYVDVAINDNYESEYFKDEEAMYEWLKERTDGVVTSKETLESFNDDHEEKGDDDENFIHVHQFAIVK